MNDLKDRKPGVLDDMDEEFEALETRQNTKNGGKQILARYDVASLGEKDEKFEELKDFKTSEQAAFRDETIHASSGTLANMPSKKRP